jgi:hypothetical protein
MDEIGAEEHRRLLRDKLTTHHLLDPLSALGGRLSGVLASA